MKTTVLQYNIVIKKEGKHYIAYAPTLEISDFGKSIEEAKKNIQEAITCHVEGLIKTNDEVPTPDTEEYYISRAAVSFPSNIRFAI